MKTFRIPPPIVLLSAILLMWLANSFLPSFNFAWPGALEFMRKPLAILLICEGLLLDVVSIALFFHRKTTISPLSFEKSSSLVTNGFNRLSRNPMYLGMLCILLGAGLFFGTWFVLPVAIGFVWYISKFQILPEERALEGKFGDEYRVYKQRVRRWI